MGKKYSINSVGQIVAERDIYSLGGFIPKGSIGGMIASEEQLSQDGECWLAGGDICTRTDIVIKDNAFIGKFELGTSVVHTDGITEFSGNTKIPGILCWRTQSTYPKCDSIIKDSFIGVTMDVPCGPATNKKAFPFEQGRYNQDAPKGTAFTSSTMKLDAENFVRNTATLRLGTDTYIYVPSGYNARIYWAYYDEIAGQLKYAGESETATTALYKLSHPVYNLCMIAYAKGPTITPAELEASGAKILGCVSGSVRSFCNGISASGTYVLSNCNVSWNVDDFSFAIDRHAMFAGYAYDCNINLKVSADASVCGRFSNIKCLDVSRLMGSTEYTNANRDKFVTASDCPLLRIDAGFVSGPLVNAGGVTLRNCIVPKASFTLNKVLGNTYEDIDFSYAQEHIGKTHAGRTLRSSHVQGHYDMFSGEELTGVISRPENIDNTARLTEDHINIQLDSDLIEQGSYQTGNGVFYEVRKDASEIRVRTKTPLATRGVVFPTLPPEYKMKAVLYLDDEFIVRSSETDVTELKGEYPYFVASFRKADDSAITVKEFISKGLFIRSSDYTKYPIISGSGYVGAGVSVRGDVQVIGQKYEKRYLDVNEWERGENTMNPGASWAEGKNLTNQERHFELKEACPVEPGGTLIVNSGYFIYAGWMDENGHINGTSGWWASSFKVPGNARYVGLVVKKASSAAAVGDYISYSDIPLAEIRYITEFKTTRYITNELDRKDPSDIFLSQDAWQVAAISTGAAYVGREYDSLKQASNIWCILKRPINAGKSWTVALGDAVTYAQFSSSWDALKKLLGLGVKDNAALTGLELKRVSNTAMTLSDVPAARFVVEYVPTPRILVPYNSVTNVQLERTRVRLYDNAVLSKTFTSGTDVVLKGNAVLGDVPGDCVCANGHDDAIIKQP